MLSAKKYLVSIEQNKGVPTTHVSLESRSMDDLRSSIAPFPKASAAQLASRRPRARPVRGKAVNRTSFDSNGVNLDFSTATASDPGSADSTAPMSMAFTGLKIADDVPQAEHDTIYKPSPFKAVAEEKFISDTQPADVHKEKVEPVVSPPKSEEIDNLSTSRHSRPMVDSEHSSMLAQIKAPIKNDGWIFIFSSQDNKLVKVGKATTTTCRKAKILFGCFIPDSAECAVDLRFVLHPEQVIKLVHLELRNFEAKISCEHNKTGFVPQVFRRSIERGLTCLKMWQLSQSNYGGISCERLIQQQARSESTGLKCWSRCRHQQQQRVRL